MTNTTDNNNTETNIENTDATIEKVANYITGAIVIGAVMYFASKFISNFLEEDAVSTEEL